MKKFNELLNLAWPFIVFEYKCNIRYEVLEYKFKKYLLKTETQTMFSKCLNRYENLLHVTKQYNLDRNI